MSSNIERAAELMEKRWRIWALRGAVTGPGDYCRTLARDLAEADPPILIPDHDVLITSGIRERADAATADVPRLLDEIERLRFSVQTNRNIGDQLADEFRRAEEAEAKRDAAQSTLDRIHALAHNIHGPLTQQRGRDFLFDVKRILNGGDD